MRTLNFDDFISGDGIFAYNAKLVGSGDVSSGYNIKIIGNQLSFLLLLVPYQTQISDSV